MNCGRRMPADSAVTTVSVVLTGRLEGCEKRQLEPLEKEEIWKKLEEEES